MTQSVVTFYRFFELDHLDRWRDELDRRASKLDIKGTILLAEEGINGTLTGSRDALNEFAGWLAGQSEFAGMPFKYSTSEPDNPVFYRLKVRVKPEIVSMGRPGVRPAAATGEHVNAREFNELLDDPDVMVIDTRNGYEIEIGSFPGAVDPQTRSFRQFPDFVAGNLNPDQQSRVAMFCTGGVRCEKASAYLLEQGFSKVYQLDGGILKYLETVNPEENRWEGECFVFDQRVSVDDTLAEGSYEQCFACRRALGEVELASPDYVQGVSCQHCVNEQAPEQTAAFSERQKQMELAAARGDQHIGKRQPD